MFTMVRQLVCWVVVVVLPLSLPMYDGEFDHGGGGGGCGGPAAEPAAPPADGEEMRAALAALAETALTLIGSFSNL